MSVFYGVRLTDEMDAKVQATGMGKSAVVQEALEAYFGRSQEAAKAEQIIIERAKPEKKQRASAKPIESEQSQAELKTSEPRQLARCQECFAPAGMHQRFCSKK
jgi:predicted DNA-binding protein